MVPKYHLFRITTIPLSLHKLLRHQLKFISSFYQVKAVSSPGPLMQEVQAEEGVDTIAVPMTRAITPIADLIALFKLYLLFRKHKPMIVHSHTPKAGLLGMIAARLANVPVRMHTVAGLPLLEATGMKRKILNLVEKITYSCAHKVYPNSFRLQEIIEEHGFCDAIKVSVIGNGSSNGIDTDFFSFDQVDAKKTDDIRSQLGLEDGDVVLCFVGRMVADKGINELVRVFVSVAKVHPHMKLILTGPFEHELDPLHPEVEQIIRTHPLIKWVDYQADVRPYLAVSNLFVFPSYREGFPNVVLQAGAMGLPCIVSNINGCNEIIKENVNGLIVQPKDALALKKAIEFMINNPDERKKMASASRELVIEKYSQEYFWNELLREYKKLETDYLTGKTPRHTKGFLSVIIN